VRGTLLAGMVHRWQPVLQPPVLYAHFNATTTSDDPRLILVSLHVAGAERTVFLNEDYSNSSTLPPRVLRGWNFWGYLKTLPPINQKPTRPSINMCVLQASINRCVFRAIKRVSVLLTLDFAVR